MMENSKIEWTDHTFNPWQGCLKVSPGCHYCYAETLSNRWGRDIWGPGPKRQRTSESYWRNPLKWDRQAAKEGRRFRVFCASMADVFEDNPQLKPWRVDLLNLIQETPHLDWLLLTKRPEKVNQMVEWATGFSDSEMWFHSVPNVWIGTSIENQEYADKRIPELLRIPATIRFLSCEPLLGPLCLTHPGDNWLAEYTDEEMRSSSPINPPQIHWVIVGGESGPNARPCHPTWVRSLRDECQASGVAFFFKQWGEWDPENKRVSAKQPGGWLAEDGHFVEGLSQMKSGISYQCISKVGKHAAGRMLDGREWSEFPTVAERSI